MLRPTFGTGNLRLRGIIYPSSPEYITVSSHHINFMMTQRRVRSLVTLGTPHKAPPSGSGVDRFDQTRGLLTFINDNYPGAFDARVKYSSVIGCEVTGQLNVFNLPSLLAYLSYLFLSGKGAIAGDGIIPIDASELSGANSVVCQVT